RQIAVAHRKAFCDLQLEESRIEIALLERFLDDGGQTFVLELTRREIHGHAQRWEAALLPVAQLFARGAQHPLADRDDAADLLRKRDEMLRLDESEARLVPANQRFEPDDLSRRDFHLRLVIELEFLPLHRAPQRGLERQPHFPALPRDRPVEL